MSELEQLLREDAAAWQVRADTARDQLRLDQPQGHVTRGPRRGLILGGLTAAVLLGLLSIVMLAPRHDSSGQRGHGSGGEASCVAPTITMDSESFAPSDRATVFGQYFVAACNDVQVRGAAPSPNTPISAVRLRLVDSAGHTHTLVTVRPDSAGSFTAVIAIPANARLGPARIVDNLGDFAAFKIVAT